MPGTVGQWLESLDLAKYEDVFVENEIRFEDLADLTEDDLKEMGLPIGPRRRVMRAIGEIADGLARPAIGSTSSRSAGSSVERRQLTVLFCDMVGSTALSSELDPEDLREVLTQYQNTVAGVTTRYDGHVAKYMGDGVLCYFGWPKAHEDDAARAVRAGLDILEELEGIVAPDRRPITAHIGVSTGLVIVGDLLGEGAAQEEVAVGETPNLAARMQELAEPGSLVVSENTRRRLGVAFEVINLGPRALKGIRGQISAYKVVGPSKVQSRFEARSSTPLTKIVGRDEELSLVLDRWRRAQTGDGQLLLLNGEAGIGKSRILRAVMDSIADQPHFRINYQCSAYHSDSALHPAIQQLTFAAGLRDVDDNDERLDKLEAVLTNKNALLIGALVGLEVEERFGLIGLTPQEQREQTLQALADELITLASDRPVLLVVEDVQWIDPSTLELLDLCVSRIGVERVLILVTGRPGFDHDFDGQLNVTKLMLNRLERAAVENIIVNIAGEKRLPDDLVDTIVARTDGIPLFVEEMTKAVIESGALNKANESGIRVGSIDRFSVPETLHDSLVARLDRLASAKEIAQIAAGIGRDFDYRLLCSITEKPEEELQSNLDQLADAEIVFRRGSPPDASYTFKHALIQDAAYQSLLISKRRKLHARIGQALEQEFSDIVSTQPELVAHHYTEAGFTEKAIDYWQTAGLLATRRSANAEAESHFRHGLKLLSDLPAAPERQHKEAELQNALGVCLMPTRGFGSPDVADAFSRAAELCQETGDTHGLCIALRGLGQYQMISGDLRNAVLQSQKVTNLAGRFDDPGILIEAHHLGWISRTFAGDFVQAHEHAEAGRALYHPERDHELTHIYSGHDPGVCCRSFGALPLWQLGYSDQALANCREGEKLAKDLEHPFSITVAHWATGMLRQLRCETQATLTAADSMIAHSREGGFRLMSTLGHILRGWAGAEDGELADGIQELQRGIEQLRMDGTEFAIPSFFAILADFHGRNGAIQKGLEAVNEGLTVAKRNGDNYSLPELHRVKGELLLASNAGSRDAATECFKRALHIAAMQEAKSLQLRASISLAAYWGTEGRRNDAREIIAPIYNWFSEGFDTRDLVQARNLIDELS